MLTKDGAKKYTNNLDNVYARNLDAWDYAWSYSRWRQNGLSIVPIKNLVKNIGFGNNATHTKKKRQLSSIEAEPMAFPLKHPSNIKRNFMADLFTVRHLYLGYPLPEDVGITRSIYDPIRKKLPERFRWIMDTLLNPIMRK